MGERNRELHELMMQIKSGDECAFQRLMNIMTPGLITLGLAYLKNAHDVEDCVQETFITIAAKSTTFFVSRGGKIANTSFYYNYAGAPNDGFYWIDDLDNEKIEVIPPSPEREGYEFGGWYKEYTEDGEYVYKETCLYAKWQKG